MMANLLQKIDRIVVLQRRMGVTRRCKWIGLALLLLCGFNQDHMSVQAGDNRVADLVPLVGIRQISAQNSYHTCGVTTEGGVKCWGANFYHQLGDGTTVGRSTPVDVIGLSTGVAAVATGEYHTCALTEVGGVKCWGGDDGGEPGSRIGFRSDRPVDIAGLTANVAAIAAGSDHTCALMKDGSVKCWGKNRYGQLGDGTQVDRAAPVDVVGLPTIASAIAVGSHHTCALTSDGGVRCWGWNIFGQLGDGTRSDRWSPVAVDGLGSDVAAIATGAGYSCAVTRAGGVKCWGANGYGQLGDGSTTDRRVPTDVIGLTNGGNSISTGGSHTCAARDNGHVTCWGHNGAGQLGDGTEQHRSFATDIMELSGAVQAIVTGGYHTCVLIATSGIMCWGYNLHGQLGNDTRVDSPYPLTVKAKIDLNERFFLPIIRW